MPTSIQINQVTYHQQAFTLPLIQTTLASQKYGLIGANGVGKSTLLKLITGELTPSQGSVQSHGLIAFVPQRYASENTVLGVLGIANIYQAYQRIKAGSTAAADYDCVGERWAIEQEITDALALFATSQIGLQQRYDELSGGQQTQVLLARAVLQKPDFYLIDEPVMLDSRARSLLMSWLQGLQQGCLLVSHDRRVLQAMDVILELTPKGLLSYGGNFAFYKAEKAKQTAAARQALCSAEQHYQKTKQSLQQSAERHQHAQSRGRKAFLDGSVDKLTAKSKKGRSERTNKRQTTVKQHSMQRVESDLQAAKARQEPEVDFHVNLAATYVPKGKMVLSVDGVGFAYPGGHAGLLHDVGFSITGPERVALVGDNGSGKTTLVRLLLGELQPITGTITFGVKQVAHLDQHTRWLNDELSLLDNFLQLNPNARRFDAYSALAGMGFRAQAAEQLIGSLSAGQRMRAGLVIRLLSNPAPQLIILDEPTNNLDIPSIEAIELALRLYEGALLVVSHDEVFLQSIGVRQYVTLS